MSSLFLTQLQQIEAVIKDRTEHIEVAQSHIDKLQFDIRCQEEYRRKVLASKEFCENVLVQIRTALVMLHRLDAHELIAFEKTVKSQFRLDSSLLLAEDAFIKMTEGMAGLNSPPFTGTCTPPISVSPLDTKSDIIFLNDIERRHFKIICDKLSLSGINVNQCYLNNPRIKCWVVSWGEKEAKLIWEWNQDWRVEPLDEGADKLIGVWEDFDLKEYLETNGIDTNYWYQDPYIRVD